MWLFHNGLFFSKDVSVKATALMIAVYTCTITMDGESRRVSERASGSVQPGAQTAARAQSLRGRRGMAFIFFTQEASLWERENRDRDRRPLQALAQGRRGDERECIKISHGRMVVGHGSFFCFFLLWLGLVGYMIYGRGGRMLVCGVV